MYDLLIRNIRFPGNKALQHIGIVNGSIVEIGNCPHDAREVADAEGDMILPGFVESHIHLDTALTAGTPRWNQSGTLHEGIRIWSERKKQLTREDVMERAMEVIRWQLAQGILHVRSYVDISDPRLTALHALLEVKERAASYMDLQLVAFPQEGVIACPANQQRLEEALRLGADAVSAIPHFEHTREDGVRSLEMAFQLAEKYDKMVHVCCDEIDDGESRFLEVVASLAIRTGLKHRVTASHANAMALYNDAYAAKLAYLLKQAEMNIVVSPPISSTVQGRFTGYPKNRGLTRVKELWQQGINVSMAHDDIMTPFYPLGIGSMLQSAYLAVHFCHMSGREEIIETVNMITTRGARTLHIEHQYGVKVGKPANFITLPAEDPIDAIRRQPRCRLVVGKGKIIAQTEPKPTSLRMEGKEYRIDFSRPSETEGGSELI